jgi:polar amino acid transport system substrate-binding protein
MIKDTAFLAGMVSMAIAAAAGAAPADVVKDLAPSGRLRAAINFGNPVLAQKDGATGAPQGVSVALARELARRLDVPVEFIPFAEAGQVVDAVKADAWDIAFLAIDPSRAAGIDFTPPYVVLTGIYVAPSASPLKRIEDIDRDGVRVGVALGSAYDLFLTRTLKHARIVRAANSALSLDLLPAGQADTLAGVKQPLTEYAAAHPDLAVIPGNFMQINQAMGTPKGREAGLRFLSGFIEAQKASGFVASALAASGQGDATVAPAAAP